MIEGVSNPIGYDDEIDRKCQPLYNTLPRFNSNPIIVIPNDVDAGWECECGNDEMGSGFATCNNIGVLMEPLIGSDWNGMYICGGCGQRRILCIL
jgi:hypothetical protein